MLTRTISQATCDICIIWELGGSSSAQKTPTGSLTNFHTREANHSGQIITSSAEVGANYEVTLIQGPGPRPGTHLGPAPFGPIGPRSIWAHWAQDPFGPFGPIISPQLGRTRGVRPSIGGGANTKVSPWTLAQLYIYIYICVDIYTFEHVYGFVLSFTRPRP